MSAARDFDALLEAKIDARLRALGIVVAVLVYSSRGPLPPGYSRRRFIASARTMPGARRLGGKRGRSVEWQIDRADWERGLAAPVVVESPTSADVIDIDAWIHASGHRATKGR